MLVLKARDGIGFRQYRQGWRWLNRLETLKKEHRACPISKYSTAVMSTAKTRPSQRSYVSTTATWSAVSAAVGVTTCFGDTHCARSADNGQTWTYQGVVLARETNPPKTNHLRLSRTREGVILAYGQRDVRQYTQDALITTHSEPVLCRSTDGGQTWLEPEIIPFQIEGPYEISNPIVVANDGRWLAPTATLHDGRYGEVVVVHESCDEGETWPEMYTVFQDPGTGIGYLEQKLVECKSAARTGVILHTRMGNYL